MPGPFLTARWESLVFLNYACPRAWPDPLVPRGTELDTWQGQTLVSLVGFLFAGTRLKGLPVPGHRTFEEVKLRFYVRRTTPAGELAATATGPARRLETGSEAEFITEHYWGYTRQRDQSTLAIPGRAPAVGALAGRRPGVRRAGPRAPWRRSWRTAVGAAAISVRRRRLRRGGPGRRPNRLRGRFVLIPGPQSLVPAFVPQSHPLATSSRRG
jgi:hypothetical protein